MSRALLLALAFGAALHAQTPAPGGLGPVNPPVITAYARCIGTVVDSGRTRIVLRKGKQDGEARFLTADPALMTVAWRPAAGLAFTQAPWDSLAKTFQATAYFRTIRAAEARCDTAHDAGLKHVDGDRQGAYLTVDLCPAQKPLERRLFVRLREAFEESGTPVPIGLSITGSWVRQHREDFDWLIAQSDSRRIAPIWINHSFHHRTDTAQPARSKYLLDSAVNLDEEILGTETMLLAHGRTPSLFFRFPGLVSDRALFLRVTAYGLIPVGSDAWLAKAEIPGDGSIILIHGNSNEQHGVRKFLSLLDSKKEAIKKGAWRLLDLREGLLAEDSGRAPVKRANP